MSSLWRWTKHALKNHEQGPSSYWLLFCNPGSGDLDPTINNSSNACSVEPKTKALADNLAPPFLHLLETANFSHFWSKYKLFITGTQLLNSSQLGWLTLLAIVIFLYDIEN